MYPWFFEDKPTRKNKNVILFILERYFYYSVNAMLFGYPLIANKVMQIRMAFCLHSDLPYDYRKKIHFSQKAIGFSFFLKLISPKSEKQGYTFYMNKKMKEKIYEQIETDNVYKLMGRK